MTVHRPTHLNAPFNAPFFPGTSLTTVDVPGSRARGRRWAVARLPERLRKLLPSARRAPESAPPVTQRPRQGHNLFEAAAEYVAACAEDDPARAEEAASRVSPGMLSFGVNELACRALLTLARERDESPRAVARSLLGLREVPARAPSDDA